MIQLKPAKKPPRRSRLHKPTKPEATAELSDEQLDKVNGGVEQTLNIGSQSGGAGAGKITFNPF